jgi:hypothetical protein
VENSGLSGNVIENTDSYELKTGMLLKRKAGFRIQESGTTRAIVGRKQA